MYINGTIVQMSGYQIIGTESYVATNSGTLAKFEISSGAIRRATASSGRKKEHLSGKKGVIRASARIGIKIIVHVAMKNFLKSYVDKLLKKMRKRGQQGTRTTFRVKIGKAGTER